VFLETERFIINNLNLDDLQFLAKLDSDPLVRKYLDGKVKTIDETREYLSENIESYWRLGLDDMLLGLKRI
jgi:hypothetical protein